MRGEDAFVFNLPTERHGSPPHARGRQGEYTRTFEGLGITPACAGKTMWSSCGSWRLKDHPRMRGEDGGEAFVGVCRPGSPPHARGRQLDSPGNPAKSFSAYQFSFALNLVL